MAAVSKQILYMFPLCVAVRLMLILAAHKLSLSNSVYHYALSGLLFLSGMGFAYQTVSGKRNTGAFGQPVWWQSLRPFHSALLIGASMSIYLHQRVYAIILLTVDLLIGVLSFMSHHGLLLAKYNF